jgi:hypothetical protein
VGTTVKTLADHNPGVASSSLKAGDVLRYKPAKMQWQVSGWHPWEDAIVAYNGGGDPDYLKKVKTKFDAIKKSASP